MRQFENFKIWGGVIIFTFLFLSGCKTDKPAKPDPLQSEQTAAHKDKTCDISFDIFFKKFQSDSVFQKQHVKFPLKNTYLDSDRDYEVVHTSIPESDYAFSEFKNDNEIVDTGNGRYTASIKKGKDFTVYHIEGIDNGIATDIKFAFINGCWYMVAIEDSST